MGIVKNEDKVLVGFNQGSFIGTVVEQDDNYYLYFEDSEAMKVSRTYLKRYREHYQARFTVVPLQTTNVLLKQLHGLKIEKTFPTFANQGERVEVVHQGFICCKRTNEMIDIVFHDGDVEVSNLQDTLLQLEYRVLRPLSNTIFFNNCKVVFKDEKAYFARALEQKNGFLNDQESLSTELSSQGELECDTIQRKKQKHELVETFEIYDMAGVKTDIIHVSIEDMENHLEHCYKVKECKSIFHKHGYQAFSHDRKTICFHFSQFFESNRRGHWTDWKMTGFLSSSKLYQVFRTETEEIDQFFEIIQENKWLHRILELKQFFDPFAGTKNIERAVKQHLKKSTFVNNDLDRTKNTEFHFDALFCKNYELFTSKNAPAQFTLPQNIFCSPPFELIDLAIGLLCHYFSNVIIHCPRSWHCHPQRIGFLKKLATERDVFFILLSEKGSNKVTNAFLVVLEGKLGPDFVLVTD